MLYFFLRFLLLCILNRLAWRSCRPWEGWAGRAAQRAGALNTSCSITCWRWHTYSTRRCPPVLKHAHTPAAPTEKTDTYMWYMETGTVGMGLEGPCGEHTFLLEEKSWELRTMDIAVFKESDKYESSGLKHWEVDEGQEAAKLDGVFRIFHYHNTFIWQLICQYENLRAENCCPAL